MKYLTLFIFGLCMLQNVQAQNKEEQAVINVIKQLFEGLKNKDADKAGKVFYKNAILQTTETPKGNPAMVKSLGVQWFLNKIKYTPEGITHDERISNYDVKIDANLAHVWTPYKYYINNKFSHCGVNSFQLFKTDEGWKIIYIIDTRRRTACK